MEDYDYPELLEKGTVIGPVTTEMRDRCKDKVRKANRYFGYPEEKGMEYWPDFLSIVRRELKDESV